jgi:hypothetical protein
MAINLTMPKPVHQLFRRCRRRPARRGANAAQPAAC